MTWQLRYIPDTKLGKQYPLMRYPWRGEAYPTREAAEQVRRACANAESLEIVEVDE